MLYKNLSRGVSGAIRRICSLLPFSVVMRLVRLLLESQGFGVGARVEKSGEIVAVRSVLDGKHNDAPVIFDIGANRGEYSELILKVFPKARIHAFEPAVESFELLRSRLKGYQDVATYNFAIGKTEGRASLYKEIPLGRIASLTKLDVTDSVLTEEVSIRRLDSLLQDLDVKQIDLLKIDVEGHEMDVLLGAEKAIRNGTIRHIQFELGGSSIDTNTTLKMFFDFLGNYNYEFFLIRPGSIYPLSKYKYLYEQYSTTNFLARRQ